MEHPFKRGNGMEAPIRQPLAALILAAGVSSHMERFKPMLPVGHESMIHKTISTVQQIGADPIVVVTGYKEDLLRQHLSGMGLVFLSNDHYASTKMFDSLLIGLDYLLPRCERLLFLPGDVPTVQLNTLHTLLQYDEQIVRPVYERRPGHPILLRRDALEKISKYHGNGGLCSAIHELELSCKDVSVKDEGVVLDADTPKEYSRLLVHNLRVGGGQECLRLDLQLRICALDAVFDASFAQLLELINLTGSLQMACRAVHISYSKGWKAMQDMEKALGFSLISRKVGGPNGGSSHLTPEALNLLECYKSMEQDVMDTALKSFKQHMSQYENLNPKVDL